MTTVMNHEFEEPNGEDYPEDPRTELADKLRGFVLQAIEQQRVPDADEKTIRKAGSLYKIDGDYLKVHLQTPAPDHIFDGQEKGVERLPDSSPHVWILVPLGEDHQRFGLEDIVVAADEIIVHVLSGNSEPLQFVSRDDYLGPLVPVEASIEEIMAYSAPSDMEQITTAAGWKQMLDNYDLRTITATRAQHPDVA